jgi:REP element-mobilizing transposase RayT
MPVKRAIPPNSGMFFITFIGYEWLSLIDTIDGYDIIYKWFDHLKSNRHFINGYAIMPNHVHVLISFINTTQSINTIIGNDKRFMAYEIINRLEKNMR